MKIWEIWKKKLKHVSELSILSPTIESLTKLTEHAQNTLVW